MTKKIVWRLKEQPTTENITLLVQNELLTKEQAREVLFSELDEKDTIPPPTTIKELRDAKEEIKFLRTLVDKLSNNDNTTIIREIETIRPVYREFPWYKPYDIWCSNTGTITDGTTLTTTGSSETMNLCSFSDINSN